MRYIYGEEFLIVNTAANLLLIAAALKARRLAVPRFRAAAAALFGSVYALAALLREDIFGGLLFRILSLIIIGLIATRPFRIKDALLNALLILTASYLSSGCILCISLLTVNISKALSQPIAVSYPMMISGFLIGCAGTIKLYDRLIRTLEGIDISKAVIRIGSKSINVQLMNDTGNLLATVTGNAVAVLAEKSFFRLTGVELPAFTSFSEFEAFTETLPEELKTRFVPIAANTVAGQAVLGCLRADEIVFDKNWQIKNIYITPSGNLPRDVDGIVNKSEILARCQYESAL